ncbi:MAG: hypothetical protein V2G48_07210 [bacterium JZ-2024 1]
MKNLMSFLMGMLGILLSPNAFASTLVQPGFGNGFLNTPVAWNSSQGWNLGVYGGFSGDEVANFFKISGAYSSGKREYAFGAADFGDVHDTFLFGVAGRYNFSASERGFYSTLLGGFQVDRNSVQDNSTFLGGMIFGQKFPQGGISVSGIFWTDVGSDAQGREIGMDFEATGNVFLNFAEKWSIFAEAYTFADAEKAGWATGLTYRIADDTSSVLAISGVTDPEDDTQVQLGLNFRF